jgi:hypothetical protein
MMAKAAAKTTKPGGKVGRPTRYTPAIGNEICRRMADGESVRQICRDEAMPHESTVRSWAIDPEHPIYTQYGAARLAMYERWGEEIIEISDDGSNDWMERETDRGKADVVNSEHIQRSRLRVDTRKWLLSKLLPKRYGDKVGVEHTGPDGGPISLEVTFVKPSH